MDDVREDVKEIEFGNYQSIKHLLLKLGKITVITGKTDTGKTTFFRGVKGAVINQSGHEFITCGEKESFVRIDDVKWIKNIKGENRYEIGDRVWEKCGRGVPDDVREALGMGEFEFGKDVKDLLNFYGQLDRAFIVQGNPSDNAKIIGSISNIHIIYNALREAEKDTKNIKKRMNLLQDQFEEYDEKLKYDDKELDKLEGLYVRVGKVFREATTLDSDINMLEKIRGIAVDVEGDLRALKLKYLTYKKMDFVRISDIIEHIEGLQDIKRRYDYTIITMQGHASDYMRYKSVSPDICLKVLQKIEMLLELKSRLLRASEDIDAGDERMGEIVANLIIVNKDMKEAEEMEKFCSKCGALEKDWDLSKVKGD